MHPICYLYPFFSTEEGFVPLTQFLCRGSCCLEGCLQVAKGLMQTTQRASSINGLSSLCPFSAPLLSWARATALILGTVSATLPYPHAWQPAKHIPGLLPAHAIRQEDRKTKGQFIHCRSSNGFINGLQVTMVGPMP